MTGEQSGISTGTTRPGVGRLTEPRYLSADELDGLLGNMGDTFRPIAATCTFAALRVSEALGLRWRDLDLQAGTLTVSGQLGADGERVPVKSTASAATVELLPALVRELVSTGHGRRGRISDERTQTRWSSRPRAASPSPAGTRSGPSTRRVTRQG